MKILGIDPALCSMGWGVIQSHPPKIGYIKSGIIKTSNNELLYLRIANIANQISELIDLYKPSAVVMEETFININAKSSLKLAYVRGAMMTVIGQKKIPFYEYAPNKIKKTIVGVGHADKEQVRHMVNKILSNTNKSYDMSYDESDALAAAYTCLVYA